MSEQEYFLSKLDDERIKELEKRMRALEMATMIIPHNLIPERVEKAFMLLDNIASAWKWEEVAAWRQEVRKFLGLGSDE